MNTPFSSHAWRELQDRAAAELSPNFADNVLRAARAGSGEVSFFQALAGSPFVVSALTAVICFMVVIMAHVHSTQVANDQRLADWQEISRQTASLELADLTP